MHSEGRAFRSSQLRASLEGAQRDSLLVVDLEERVQPCHLKEVNYSFVDLDKFHFSPPLPDGAETPHQLAHSTAVHVIHSREVEQEPFVAGTGENVYQVPQLRAAPACREFATTSTITTRSNSRVVISRPMASFRDSVLVRHKYRMEPAVLNWRKHVSPIDSDG